MISSALFAIIPHAKAQSTVPFPGPGPLYGVGIIQGGRSYEDWQQTRRDRGLDYDQNAIRRDNVPGNPYQPYPSVSPRIEPLDNYGGHRRGLYDDQD